MNQFVWTCPQCARSVPNRLDACRCGSARPFVAAADPATPWSPAPAQSAEAQPDAPPEAPARNPSGRRTWLIAVAAVALIGVGAFLAVMLRTGTTPAVASAPALVPDAVKTGHADRLPPPLGDPPPVAVDPSGAESAAMLSTEEIVTRSMPAVVTVVARDGFGSGFFVSSDTVITNAHVIAGNEVVTLLRGSSYSRTARVQSVSHEIDLAVLKLDIADFDQVVLALADPHDVTIGSDVVAIGSPRGLANTVTRGIVSAVREVNNVNMVQTDAAINPGNSGGPLLDRRGRVLGVNTMKLGRGTEGMAFAVSIRYIPRMIGTSYTPKSERDERREKGMREYTENMRALAQRADAVDANWKSFRASCDVEEGQFVEHQWFSLSDGRRVPMRDSASCGAWHGYFKESAVATRDALQRYETAARSMGLVPAQTRAARRRLNLMFPGWEP